MNDMRYTRGQFEAALESATHDVLDAAGLLDESGAQDAINLVVRTALARLDDPRASLEDVVLTYYTDLRSNAAEELEEHGTPLRVVLSWIRTVPRPS